MASALMNRRMTRWPAPLPVNLTHGSPSRSESPFLSISFSSLRNSSEKRLWIRPTAKTVSHSLRCNSVSGFGKFEKYRLDSVKTCNVASFDGASGDSLETEENYIFSKPNAFHKIRAVLFYLVTLIIAIPLFFAMLVIHPIVLLFDKYHRRAQHWINNIWANTTTSLFYKIKIEGKENLPSDKEAVVYVANHQSYLDIYTLFKLERNFKFISKTSNFLIPIVGWSMYLTGHVPLKRLDKRSQMECLKKCLELLKLGVPVLFFPEGTRTKTGKLDAFKKGAFSLAAKSGAYVVPITLLGTGKLMPNGQEGSLRGGTVRIIVHPPLRGTDADLLCATARNVIAETLVQNGYGVMSS